MAEMQDSDIINCVVNYRKEATDAKQLRMDLNRKNFDAYHLRQDWSHKVEGQSREFLPKVSTAVEQNAQIIQQGLLDIGEWFKVDPQAGIDEDTLKIKPSTIYRLTTRQFEKDGLVKKVGDAVKLGMLGGLMIAKVSGKDVVKPKYVVEKELKDGKYYNKLIKRDDKAWALSIKLLRQEDYYPDPTGRGLYEMEDSYMDLWEVKQMAEDGVYDKKVVDELTGSFDSSGSDQDWDKARETGQSISNAGFRKQVKITELWGNILDSEGNIVYENHMCTIANDRFVVQAPTPNPFWHQESPYVTGSMLSVPHAVWPKAMMDAATSLNLATNEVFNLLLDSGLISVHNIKQIRMDWLEDPNQVSDGIAPGTTLKVNSSAPPGQKVLESVFSGGNPQEATNIINMLSQESAASMFTNEIRSGGMDLKNTRATAIVENSQALNNMTNGIIKNLEGDEKSGFMTQLCSKAWKVIAQNMDDMDSNEVKALLGAKLAGELQAMGREEIFADTVGSVQFKVFGISAVMNRMKDFTKLQAMLQTISTSPVLMEEFMKKYSFNKLLTEIMKSLDIDTFKIEADNSEGGDLTQQSQGAVTGAPDMQSQIPQAGAEVNQGDMNPMVMSQPASQQAL